MDQAWDSIDQGWKDLQRHMKEKGITKPCDANEGMARLNAGGYPVNVRRAVLDGKRGASSSSSSCGMLGNLLEAKWDQRLPVDEDGRFVLDESPIAVKYLIHSLLVGSSAAEGVRQLAPDERPYLPFVSRALGLTTLDTTATTTGVAVSGMRAAAVWPAVSDTSRVKSLMIATSVTGGGRTVPGSSASGSSAAAMTGIAVTGGGSTILEPAVSDAPKAALQRWFPGEALELKFRATRDGWSPEAFHSRCDDSRRTVSLFRVYDSVIGGFSDVPWFSKYGGYAKSSGAFLFMLKDDTGNDFQPERWGTRNGHEPDAVYTDADCGPTFGSSQDDLSAKLSPSYGYAEDDGYLQTGNTSYDIPAGSAFLDLGDQTVSEIEVFELYPAPSTSNACAPLPNNPDAPAVVPIMHGDDDVYNFGALVAGSLTEERMALRDAEIELRRATARVSSAAKALEAVYGPDIAAGIKDPVVELSVRGFRMTTLRSTLQVCPDSALAARFDEARWPANEKDVDKHGRWVIDCSPWVFSKVLDVLRMRKRSAWAGDKGVPTARVAVKAVDREAFEGYVNTQFPGCESFVTDYIDFLQNFQSTL